MTGMIISIDSKLIETNESEVKRPNVISHYRLGILRLSWLAKGLLFVLAYLCLKVSFHKLGVWGHFIMFCMFIAFLASIVFAKWDYEDRKRNTRHLNAFNFLFDVVMIALYSLDLSLYAAEELSPEVIMLIFPPPMLKFMALFSRISIGE